jgi:hypothetical protein
MSINLLVWRWSDIAATASLRKKAKVTFTSVRSDYTSKRDSRAFADFDFSPFLASVAIHYPEGVPFVVEKNARHLVFSIANSDRIAVVPVLGGLAMRAGLNASEI